MRLVTKLLLSFLTIALLVLLTGSLSYYLSNEIKSDLISESKESTEKLQNLNDMSVAIQNSMLYIRNYLNESRKIRDGDESVTTASQAQRAERLINQNLNSFGSTLVRMRNESFIYEEDVPKLELLHEEIHSLLDSLQSAYDPYRSLTIELLELESEEGYGEEIFNLTLEPYFRNTLIPLLTNLRSSTGEFVDLRVEALQLRAEVTVRRIFIITIAAFLLALVLAYIIYQSIARPINSLTTAAREIGEGNMQKRIKIKSDDELGRLAETFNHMAESLSNSMVSRTYVNNIIQSMGDILLVVDAEGSIKMSNKTVYEKLGYSKGEIENIAFSDLFKTKDFKNIKLLKAQNNGDSYTHETELVTKNSDSIPVVYSYTEIEDEVEKTDNFVFVASDITAQKEAEKKISNSLNEKNILLAEIHHRVKNNLAIISGLLQMQMWNMEHEEGRNVLHQSQLRIQSIALVHEKLYQNEKFADILISDFIEELVDAVSSSFDDPNKKVTVNYDLDNIRIDMNLAIPFSLLLNECIVNAYKHAFKEKESGEITIKLQKDNDEVTVDISDNGNGLPDNVDFEKQQTLGMTLMRTLVNQLNAKAQFISENGKTGTHFRVAFSVNQNT